MSSGDQGWGDCIMPLGPQRAWTGGQMADLAHRQGVPKLMQVQEGWGQRGKLGTGPGTFWLSEPHVTPTAVLTEPELWARLHLSIPVGGGPTLLGEVTLGRVLPDEQELTDQTKRPPYLISHIWPLPPSPRPCEVLSSSPT